MDNFGQLSDELREQLRVSEDHQWSMMTSKPAEMPGTKSERMNNADRLRSSMETKMKEKFGFQEEIKFENLNFTKANLDNETIRKNAFCNSMYNMNSVFLKSNDNVNIFELNGTSSQFARSDNMKESYNNNSNDIIKNSNNSDISHSHNRNNNNGSPDKHFKALPSIEMLPRNEVLGGYIFVCNNDTMQEDLKRQLFGLPPRYRDSVRAITPGLPLFLYNYTTHQLHGIFVAASFGGTNIHPTAWKNKKCKGESRFPAQVKIRVRKICKALEEDAFRPVLHHYDGPKFRLELSVPETLALLDLCEQAAI